MSGFPTDPASMLKHALTLIHGSLSLDGLRIAWGQVWRAYDGDPPEACLRAKNARKAQLELQMGVR